MLIPRLFNNIRNNISITIAGKEGLRINPIYVDDAVAACEQILNIQGKNTFNIAGGETYTLKEICEIMGQQQEKSPTFEFSDQMQNDLIADIELMKQKLHVPKINLKKGLKLTFDENLTSSN